MNRPAGPVPPDLRLAVPAVAAWAAAAVALDMPVHQTALGVGLAMVCAGLLMLGACRRPGRLWRLAPVAAAALLCGAAGAGWQGSSGPKHGPGR